MEAEQAAKIPSALGTGELEQRETALEIMIVHTANALRHQGGEVEEPIEIETGKAILCLATIVEAGLEVHKELDHHILGDLRARKLYWKGYRWTW